MPLIFNQWFLQQISQLSQRPGRTLHCVIAIGQYLYSILNWNCLIQSLLRDLPPINRPWCFIIKQGLSSDEGLGVAPLILWTRSCEGPIFCSCLLRMWKRPFTESSGYLLSWPWEWEICLSPFVYNWIKALYTVLQGKIEANGVLYDTFPIGNSTCQECPLSPLIFVLTLVLFLKMIRKNPDILRIQIVDQHHKLSANADDLLFSLTDSITTLPNLM